LDGLAWAAVSEVIAQAVPADHLRFFPFAGRRPAADDLDGLGGVREGEPLGDGGDLQGAVLAAAVAGLSGAAGDRHRAPGQGLELGVQAGLAAFDGEDVARAAAGQVAGVPALGVQRAGGDDRPADGDAVQQRGQHRDLAGLRLDPNLAQHHAAVVVQGGQQGSR